MAANAQQVVHQSALRRAARRHGWLLMSPLVPALLLILVTFVVPIGWLFGLSLFDAEGHLTLDNYSRLLQPLYVLAFTQTFKISLMVTLACILIGYPFAYVMVHGNKLFASLAMGLLLVSLWTSLLVRTYAWLVLLQRRGVINDALLSLGLIDTPLTLVHNLAGTIIAMTHIMLPYLVLPLYASMKSIDPLYLQAAATFGASPARAFRDVFLPLSLPGLAAGATLVFVLSLGFYVTPALLGGGKVQMLSMRIASDVSLYSNWGAASSLGVVLLVATLLILFTVKKLANLGRWGN
ncbi:ABC transporter permease [Pseudomonas oryzihabitans]|uniref:ABC transporter permease n=1 Tax=Pseudomonas oryzihabitans TaxID=47885 RepID=UPI00285B1F9C|nr:ABC transporter permease [Pseudomonas psychrotolerans]MDR6676146.1 putative spermidine/putrescine transport system permease protein/spermidine/putrescine transport system permease protein [Pseudomonas psychrotolerans]